MPLQRYKPFNRYLEDIALKNKLRARYVTSAFLKKTHINIILPTFNRVDTLKDAINSVKNQLHASWTLIICDDGSTDSTQELCKRYQRDIRIKYLKLPHKGVSAARTAGLKHSKSHYICFLDSDNTWNIEYLSLMLTFMEEFNLESAYCAARLIGDISDQWLGDFFDWKACAEMT